MDVLLFVMGKQMAELLKVLIIRDVLLIVRKTRRIC